MSKEHAVAQQAVCKWCNAIIRPARTRFGAHSHWQTSCDGCVVRGPLGVTPDSALLMAACFGLVAIAPERETDTKQS